MGGESPRTFGVYFASERKVNIVGYREIIASVAEVEAAVVVFSERWEYYAGGVVFRKRELNSVESERKRHVGENHIAGSGHHVLVGAHLAFCNLEIEVRVFVIFAGGIFAVFYKK